MGNISSNLIKVILVTLIFAFGLVRSINGQTIVQSTEFQKVKTDTYYYTFASNNQSAMDNAQAEIEGLKSVQKVVLNYKSEKKQGQFIILVQEGIRTIEGEELFSIKWVKEILENNALKPVEYSFE